MAQLIRILPNPVSVDPGIPRQAPNTAQYLGEGLTDLSSTLFKLENGADRANATKIAGDVKATWDLKLSELNDTVTDPELFKEQAVQVRDQIFESQLSQARSDNSRTMIRDILSNDVINNTEKIEHLARSKTMQNALGDYAASTKTMFDYAVKAETEEERKAIIQGYAHFTGYMAGLGYLKPEIAQKNIADFDKKVTYQAQENSFYNTLEFNPSLALKELKAGKFPDIEPQKKREWEIQANTAIRQGILDQERELKRERDQADLKLQQMIDAGASTKDINAKLREYTAAGIFGFEERDKIEQKLLRPEKDSPQQIANAKKILADFNENFPDFNRIRTYRARVKEMRDSGDISDAGAANLTGHLNQIQQALVREGRAAAAEERRGEARISDAQAARIIGQNYPNDNPTGDSAKWSKSHREDVAAYNNAVFGKTDVDKAAIATKIRDDRAKAIQARRQEAERLKRLSPEEQAALNALNPQPQTKAK